MAAGDVTIAQDGVHGNVRAHPYLVALVRWCVSCLWSSATLLLHRLLAGYTVRPSITASKVAVKARAAGTDHLHPEPRVDCQVLHAPAEHSLDVIFVHGLYASEVAVKPRASGTDHLHPEPRVDCQVLHSPAEHSLVVILVHGLYGSLGNTWRQGDWRSKYKLEPNKVPLLRPSACKCLNEGKTKCKDETNINDDNPNEVTFNNREEKYYNGIQKILPKDDVFITENFFDHTMLDQVEILDNYETQAQFVRDLFENENRICDNINFDSKCEGDKVEIDLNEVNCECKVNEGRECKVGCGCVCDDCYSSCWPRDWIKEDYPEARIISINYTSDPYLWRPLWIKECKRLRLHERAEQMTKQLLDLGVGERPIIWVGHSKGGLFIKQIYCEAYEAHLQTTKDQNETKKPPSNSTENTSSSITEDHSNINENSNNEKFIIDNDVRLSEENIQNETVEDLSIEENSNNVIRQGFEEINARNNEQKTFVKIDEEDGKDNLQKSLTNEDLSHLRRQGGLWARSAGFMFYSVPHRGSPLAGIKTPLTARSIELLEISKDCSLVLSLQDRWLKATESSRPQVRSLVETCRTLMAVLWLRIVSVPSADAGIGALYGVSVDHREICKPSSRDCLLYEELMKLMHAALNQCKCDS